MTRSIHPAQFSTELLLPMAEMLKEAGVVGGMKVLDPFAGLGHRLEAMNVMYFKSELHLFGVEIEPALVKKAALFVQRGDATNLETMFLPETFDAAVTSPTYGNGCNDNFHARDNSKRNTYIHRIREHEGESYELDVNNTGQYGFRGGQPGINQYLEMHRLALLQLTHVLKPGAPFLLNVKNFVVGATYVNLKRHMTELAQAVGFVWIDERLVYTPGMRGAKGKNQPRGTTQEYLIMFTCGEEVDDEMGSESDS